MCGLGLKALFHLLEDVVKAGEVDLAMKSIQDLDKTAHVCAFKMVRKIHIHVDRGNSFLFFFRPVEDRNGIRDIFDPHLFDVDVPMVGLVLDIFHNRRREVGGAGWSLTPDRLVVRLSLRNMTPYSLFQLIEIGGLDDILIGSP